MRSPTFSVILPTKNRPELLSYVIDSILMQDFPDFELIISDNSDDDQSFELLKQYQDSRIKYFKTGSLSMVENWNYGYSQAIGKYFLLIIDKYLMKAHVLSILSAYLNIHPTNLVSWDIDIEPRHSININYYQGTQEVRCYTTTNLLQKVINQDNEQDSKTDRVLPKGRNCCIPSPLYQNILKHNGPLAIGYAPDYTIAFKILFETLEVFHFECSFYSLFGNETKYSLGRLFDAGQHQEAEHYINASDNIYQRIKDTSPIPIYTSFTVILSELVSVAQLYNYSCEFNIPNCYIQSYRYISEDIRLFQSNWRYRHHQLHDIRHLIKQAELDKPIKSYILIQCDTIDYRFPKLLCKKILCLISKKLLNILHEYTYIYYA